MLAFLVMLTITSFAMMLVSSIVRVALSRIFKLPRLAVIVVLGIVVVITFPNMTDVLKSSKLKSEEAFVERISQSIETIERNRLCKNG